MVMIFLTLFLLLTIWIVSANLLNRDRKILQVCIVFVAGAIAFFTAFVVQLVAFSLGIESNFIDVTTEEVIKAAAAYCLSRFAKPLAVVATLAGCEIILGKFVFPYFIDSNLIMASIAVHGLYLLSVSSAAYCMHIITGAIYNSIGIIRGLLPAIIVHLAYNSVAGFIEVTTSFLAGIVLFAVCLTIAIGLIFPWRSLPKLVE